MAYKNKSLMTKKKAFTLIELLIVIAIIGILFIVLVSNVDFATDKAKTTGVQTDFRSFQVAFETVSRENAGFNTFGWDVGDTKRMDFDEALAGYTYTNANKDAGDRVRNSYDAGDTNLNGIKDDGEVWTGRKVYTEEWTGIYTLENPGNANDKSAYALLETAINKNLDPKLHITIADDGKITMANQAMDPWKVEYHGYYITNASVDCQDRGAIVMYSNGANQEWGSEHSISGGKVTVTVPGNNVIGKDDLSIVSVYSYANGYGENKTVTYGFSQNATFLSGANNSVTTTPGNLPDENPTGTIDSYSWSEIKALAQLKLSAAEYKSKYGIELGQSVDSLYVLVDFDDYGGFVFMYQVGYSVSMNDERTNVGGYASMDLAATVENLYDNLTDTELKNAIKQVTINCNDGSDNYTAAHTYTCHMFVASHREIGGTMYEGDATYDKYLDAEGKCFEYFTSDFARQTIGGAGNYWWTRTARPDTARGFYVVSTTGGVHENDNATSTYRLVPTFVIG